MNILITNDDGIHAPGINALANQLKDKYHVWVVAPDSERSACGHGILLNDPYRVKTLPANGCAGRFAINGLPADCVKIAVRKLLPHKPDLVLSGINLGGNTGINVIYSGTVAGAVEGAVLGIPAAALSLTTYESPDFGPACQLAETLVHVAQSGMINIEHMLLNINIPPVDKKQIQAIEATIQGASRFQEHFEKHLDESGEETYWLGGDKEMLIGPEHSDEKCIQRNNISITPLHFDWTHYYGLECDHDHRRDFKLSPLIEAMASLYWS